MNEHKIMVEADNLTFNDHHYFIANLTKWEAVATSDELIDKLDEWKADGLAFKVYIVPGDISTKYKIKMTIPLVDGVREVLTYKL